MVVDHFLPIVKANDLGEGVMCLWRGLFTGLLIDAVELRQLIYHSIPNRNVRADGWVHFSNLVDHLAGKTARPMWEKETGRARLV